MRSLICTFGDEDGEEFRDFGGCRGFLGVFRGSGVLMKILLNDQSRNDLES